MPHFSSNPDLSVILKESRYASLKPKPNFKQSFPHSFHVLVSSLAEASNREHAQLVHDRLCATGALIVKLEFEDSESKYLSTLVERLCQDHSHGQAMAHSSARGAMWDVKPLKESIQISKQGLARSETMEEFPWHTDCSFDMAPPRYFALHVLQHDRCNGGTLSILPLDSILSFLTKSTIEALHAPEYELVVPQEFNKGIESVVGSVLVQEHSVTRIRYRFDTTVGLTPRARAALVDLEKVLRSEGRVGGGSRIELTPEIIPKGSVVVMDNGRFLHARNQVKDPERHLRRIRWDSRVFQSKP